MSIINRMACVLALCALVPTQMVQAALTACTTPGRDGDLNVTATNAVVNTYFPGTNSPTSGSASIVIGAVDGRGATTPITAGDLLLIVQVQGANSNTANTSSYGGGTTAGRGYTAIAAAGDYEYVRAASSVGTGGGTLTLAAPLTNSYVTGAAGTTSGTSVVGRRRFQVIRVPQYRNLTLTGSLTAPGWNGATGGIVAFDVAAQLTLSGTSVDVSGKGFRGGGAAQSTQGVAYAVAGTPDYATSFPTNGAHGQKGEGIVGTPYRTFDGANVLVGATTDMPAARNAARGAPGNAGGGGTDGNPANNEQNSGGGGGANGGQGGQGGYAWCLNYNSANGCAQSGGIGGAVTPNPGKDGLYLGGGGGSASTNDGTGTLAGGASSSGAPGGGAILIRAGTITGSGSLIANGGTFTSGVLNDGTGGGGAGGTIQIFTISNTGSVSAIANGGNGMSNTGAGASHGPGGGGGGGAVVSNFSLASSVSGGANGTTASSSTYGTSYGATPGSAGTVDTTFASTSIPGRYYSGAECTPTVTKAFAPAVIPVGGNTRLTISIVNPNPTLAMSSLAVNDTFPTGVTVGGTPTTATSCTNGSVGANAGANAATLSGATLAAASNCAYSVNVTAGASGSFTNTIPVGGTTATIGSGNVTNAAATSAVLSVTQGLTISKLSRTVYDPSNLYTNPKAIPGAYVQYSLTVRNPSNLPVSADSVVLTDAIPTNTQLVVSPAYVTNGAANARGPFQYNDGADGAGAAGTASGLSFTYTSLADGADSPSFSSDGSTFTYTPTVGGNGVDPTVSAVQFRMFGTMAPNSVFTVNFLVRIN